MSVKIINIKSVGIPDKERLVLKVLNDDDIGYYVIFKTSFIEERIYTHIKNTFWFPDKKVRKGDFIVLYTKSGIQSEAKNKMGTISHIFYWGLKEAIWGRKDDAVFATCRKRVGIRKKQLVKEEYVYIR